MNEFRFHIKTLMIGDLYDKVAKINEIMEKSKENGLVEFGFSEDEFDTIMYFMTTIVDVKQVELSLHSFDDLVYSNKQLDLILFLLKAKGFVFGIFKKGGFLSFFF